MCWIYFKKGKEKKFSLKNSKSQPSFYFPSRFKESYVFAKKDDFPTKAQYTSPVAAVVAQSTDFPTLGETMPGYSAQLVSEKPVKVEATTRKQPNFSVEEDFPSLGGFNSNSGEPRFSSMPSASIFSNPSSHLSVLNKKKHRLQKWSGRLLFSGHFFKSC